MIPGNPNPRSASKATSVAGSTLADIFGMAYLYNQGLPLWSIFLTYALIQAFPLFIRPFIARFGARVGARRASITGTLLFAGNYLLLSRVHGVSAALGVFAIYSALSSVAYWTPFNIYFSKLSTKENRGEDIGAKEMLVTIAQAVTPAVAGITIAARGFLAPFVAATIVTLAALIPLALLPEVRLERPPRSLTFFRKMDWRAFFACFAHGWIESANAVVWPLVVFLLFNNYVIAGVLASLIVVVRMTGLLVVGRSIDHGRRRFVYLSALALIGVVTAGRMLMVTSVPRAICFDILYAIALCFYGLAFETVLYDSLDGAENTWQSSIGVEGAYDLGALGVWLLGALLIFHNVNARYAVGLGLVGIVFLFPAFRSLYRSDRAAAGK